MKLTEDEYEVLTSIRSQTRLALEKAQKNAKYIEALRRDLDAVGMEYLASRLEVIGDYNQITVGNLPYVIDVLDTFREEHR